MAGIRDVRLREGPVGNCIVLTVLTQSRKKSLSHGCAPALPVIREEILAGGRAGVNKKLRENWKNKLK
jgi:hypothetical protein